MHRALEDPRVAPVPDLPVTIDLLRELDVPDYLRLRPGADVAEILGRLQRGLRCFIARYEGRIVHAGWVTTSHARVDYLDVEMPLAPGDAYQFESFTAPAFRGRGIAAARVSAMADHLARDGQRRLIACVLPENTAALRVLEKAGYRAVGRIGALRCGPWRRIRIHMDEAPPTD